MKTELPAYCYSVSPYTGQAVRIIKGERVLWGVRGHETADAMNRALGVTRRQQAAMVGGVSYGWDSPQADPENYNAAGLYVGPAE